MHYGLACSHYFTGSQSAANKKSLIDIAGTPVGKLMQGHYSIQFMSQEYIYSQVIFR